MEEEREIMEVPPRYPNFEQTAIKEFWDALENEKLITTRCESCGKIEFPPKIICTSCYSDDMEWVDLPLQGKLYSFAEMFAVPSGFNPPITVAVVELENGVRLFGHVINASYDELKVGDDIEITFEEMNWFDYKKHKYFVFKKK
jgi:hypothetical protein